MSKLRDQVIEFHKKFDMPVGTEPKMISEERLRNRLNLIGEEFFELLDAVFGNKGELNKAHVMDDIKTAHIEPGLNDRLPEILDAMGDLDYVVEGTRVELGVDGGPIADEIQRANMDKIPGVVGDRYGGTGAKLIRPMKPEGWKPPQIMDRLYEQGWDE